jgi:uncharacterized protein YbjT (DUF2867 family)
MSKPLVAVFTGNSNCGSACIEWLLTRYADQVNVRGVFRTEEKAKPYREKHPQLEVVVGADATRPETMDAAFQGAQAACIVFPHEPTSGYDRDLVSPMVNAAAASNGLNYVCLVAAYTLNDMEGMHLMNASLAPGVARLEQLAKETGLKYTVLLSGCFMENLLMHFKRIKATSVYTFPDVTCAMVNTRDIGRSAAACLAGDHDQHNGKRYTNILLN